MKPTERKTVEELAAELCATNRLSAKHNAKWLAAALRAYGEQVREGCARRAEWEYLHDNTGLPEDEAYNRGVRDAVVAVRTFEQREPTK